GIRKTWGLLRQAEEFAQLARLGVLDGAVLFSRGQRAKPHCLLLPNFMWKWATDLRKGMWRHEEVDSLLPSVHESQCRMLCILNGSHVGGRRYDSSPANDWNSAPTVCSTRPPWRSTDAPLPSPRTAGSLRRRGSSVCWFTAGLGTRCDRHIVNDVRTLL